MSRNLVADLKANRKKGSVFLLEYLAIRSTFSGLITIFEGKECLSVYTHWFAKWHLSNKYKLLNECRSLIVDGKSNVTYLQNMVSIQPKKSCEEKTFYFVDRDYDDNSNLIETKEFYITDGYSIENILFNEEYIFNYIKGYLTISGSRDYNSFILLKELFKEMTWKYLDAVYELNRVIYFCRINRISCIPDVSIRKYMQINWDKRSIVALYGSLEDLFCLLKIKEIDFDKLKQHIGRDMWFCNLNPVEDWRGKFHFDFVKKFLTWCVDKRAKGESPFESKLRVSHRPDSKSLIGDLASFSIIPPSLESFLIHKL